jgi:hypothetical protein
MAASPRALLLMSPDETLDELLALRFAVAWAGESRDEQPRLRWWKTDMVSKYGGEALLDLREIDSRQTALGARLLIP